jgi:hypothetical protein
MDNYDNLVPRFMVSVTTGSDIENNPVTVTVAVSKDTTLEEFVLHHIHDEGITTWEIGKSDVTDMEYQLAGLSDLISKTVALAENRG